MTTHFCLHAVPKQLEAIGDVSTHIGIQGIDAKNPAEPVGGLCCHNVKTPRQEQRWLTCMRFRHLVLKEEPENHTSWGCKRSEHMEAAGDDSANFWCFCKVDDVDGHGQLWGGSLDLSSHRRSCRLRKPDQGHDPNKSGVPPIKLLQIFAGTSRATVQNGRRAVGRRDRSRPEIVRTFFLVVIHHYSRS